MFRAPEQLPEHVSYEAFWTRFNRFVFFSGVSISISLLGRYVDSKAYATISDMV